MIATLTQPGILDAPHVSTRYKPNAKKKAGEARRINLLVEMDTRRKHLLGVRDRAGLVELAGEYMLLGSHGGCPDTASQILAEVERL